MIRPFLSHDALLADIAAARDRPGELHLWWLGQSGFLVQWAGRHLLLDPYLSDSLTKKYATTDKPHTRMTELAIEPRRLDFIDVVTASHGHTDHLDPETLGPLREANPQLAAVVPAAIRDLAEERFGGSVAEMAALDAGESAEFADFRVTAIPAAHEKLDRNSIGQHLYLGYVVECGPWTLYHSGDTVIYEGMAERLRRWKIDLALLPINGRGPERRVSGNLWGREAAWLAKEVATGLVVPCHYEMFTFNTAPPDEFERECQRLVQPYRVLRCGERLSCESRTD